VLALFAEAASGVNCATWPHHAPQAIQPAELLEPEVTICEPDHHSFDPDFGKSLP